MFQIKVIISIEVYSIGKHIQYYERILRKEEVAGSGFFGNWVIQI